MLLILASFHTVGDRSYKVDRIVIDPGHGGKDPGTIGEVSLEKDVALAIAKEVKRVINENMPDVDVTLTRDNDDFPSLNERSDKANEMGADLFISIHCNAVANPRVFGSETYVMGLHMSDENLGVAQRENSVILMEEGGKDAYDGFDPASPESYILFNLFQSAYQQNSISLAQKIEEQFKDRVGRHSRGVKTAGFLVLWRTAMPSVLVEVGYLSNQKEEKELNDKLNQVYIASGIFRAFRDYKKEIESTN